MPFLEEKKVFAGKLYKGYFNYFILGEIPQKSGANRQIKTHHFVNLTKREVRQLLVQFQNAKVYKFMGYICVRQNNKNEGIFEKMIEL